MYNKNKHIHFVGIGGIGMSGIALIIRHQGYTVSGCDLDLDQQSITDLQKAGCTILQGNNTPDCHSNTIDILVYSTAVALNNPEIIVAKKRGIPIVHRSVILAELMRTKHSIAVSGSHGKTTTSSLISHVLIEAQYDPTIVIGGHLKNISSNARAGNGDFLVAEADESDRSLLNLRASIAVLTNIDLEHLETYRDLDDIKNTFKQFLENLPFYGTAIVCTESKHIRSLLPIANIKTITYGLDSSADIWADNITLLPNGSTFTLHKKNRTEPIGIIKNALPGAHNVLNALAAYAVADDIGIPFTTIVRSLENFQGIERRFSYCGSYKGAEFFDDYGHHPKEIGCTLQVARQRTKGNITVVFQPHRYTRTQRLWDDFVHIFAHSNIKHIVITDIYPASEVPIKNVTSEKLVQAIAQKNPHCAISYAPYSDSFDHIKPIIDKYVDKDDLVVLLGAGKINKIISHL